MSAGARGSSSDHTWLAHREPLSVRRFADLQPMWRWIAWLIVAVVVLFPLAATAQDLSDGWVPIGDEAIIALRSVDVGTGSTPVLGQPTTGDAGNGRSSNQLGPSEYWVLAPFELALGQRAGLAIGTAVLTAMFLVGIALYSFRHGGLALMALMAAGCSILIVHLGTDFVHQPLNSEIATFGIPLVLIAAWACLNGDTWAFPVLLATASFVLQSHIAVGVVIAVPALIGLYGTVVTVGGRGRPAAAARSMWRWWTAIGVLLVVFWVPPLINEFTASQSNVAALVSGAIGQPGARMGLRRAVGQITGAVGPVPFFARHIPYGEQLDPRPFLPMLIGFLTLVAVGVLAVVAHRRGELRVRRLLVVLLAVLPLGVVSQVLMAGATTFRPDVIRWQWVLSMMVWVVLAWSLCQLTERRQVAVWVASGAVGVLLGTTIVGLVGDRPDDPNDDQRALVREILAAVSDDVPAGAYDIGLSGEYVPLGIGPGVISGLEDRGFDLHVDAGFFSRAYGSGRQLTDDGRPTLWITDRAPAEVVEEDPDAEVILKTTIRDRDLTVVLSPGDP